MKDSIFLEKMSNLMEIENAITSIDVALYLKEHDENINKKINSIGNVIDSKAKVFGQKEDKYLDEKNNILKNFQDAFYGIKEEYDIQYANIQLEKQELEADLKIFISNHQDLVFEKKMTYQSEEYQKYLHTKKTLEDARDNALKLEEFNKYDKELDELIDPIIVMNMKIADNKEKYEDCEKLLNECNGFIEECIAKSFVEIGNVYNGNSSELMKVEKQNVFQKMFLPIVSKINGTKKFKANVLSKFLLESENMRNEKMTVINKNTRENTLKYIGKINEMKFNSSNA